MPTFDFQCPNCGLTFEHTRPLGSKEIPPCPQCQNAKTEKLIAPPVIQFKGAGFYATDSKPKPPKKKPKKKETTEKKGSSKEKPQKDSKTGEK